MLKFAILGIVALALGVTPGAVPQNEGGPLPVENDHPRDELEARALMGIQAIRDLSKEGIDDISATIRLLMSYIAELGKASIANLNYAATNSINLKES